MEIMINIIAVTVVLIIVFGGLTVSNAWELGGEFYIDEVKGKGRRKMWVERLLDGFEILHRI